MSARLTFEMPHGTWTAELPPGAEDVSIHAVMEYLVRPVLRAASYADELVDSVLAHDEPRAGDELDRWKP